MAPHAVNVKNVLQQTTFAEHDAWHPQLVEYGVHMLKVVELQIRNRGGTSGDQMCEKHAQPFHIHLFV